MLYLIWEIWMDTISPVKRSNNMSKIRSKNTTPELVVRKYLYARGFRYRIHDKSLPGCPDIIFKQYKVAIFINGCFWHHHPKKDCKDSHLPKSNTSFWQKKIQMNVKRDRRNYRKLRKMGWHVFVVWECCLRKEVALRQLENKIIKARAESAR